MTRLEELENMLESECPKYNEDCTTCPHSEECNEYSHLAMGYNSMCYKCQQFQNGCAGEKNNIFTGCTFRKV